MINCVISISLNTTRVRNIFGELKNFPSLGSPFSCIVLRIKTFMHLPSHERPMYTYYTVMPVFI